MRIKTFHIIIVVLFLIPLLGLIHIQIFQGNFYYDLSKKNYIRLIPLEASRGKVFDRNGKVLIDNLPSFNLAILPQEFKQQDNTFLHLSKILKIDKTKLLSNFRKFYSAPFSPIIIAKNISKKKAILLEEKKSLLPGIFIQVKPKRLYPYGKICAHVLGYLGLIDRSKITRLKDYGYKIKDIIGYTGVEEYYDKYLRGEDGGIQVKVDHRGRQKRILGIRSAKKGRDLTLTIDIRIQQVAFESLSGYKGSIVVMDPHNGEILAMVSSPSFNPNIFNKTDFDSKIKWLFKNPKAPLLNRSISGLYPPGSTFKMIAAVASLETDKLSTQRKFYCPGKLDIGNAEFECWSEHGSQNLEDAIVHSCNVFFYKLGLMVGPGLLNRYAVEFGLGRLSGVDLPYELKGFVSNPGKSKLLKKSKWYDGDTANFSIGQGELLVTPIQMVRLMASVVNGGRLVTPHLLRLPDNNHLSKHSSFIKLNLKRENLKLLKLYLRKAVADSTGTAHILNLTNLTVGGKTGTAQTARRKSHAWFVGFCPFEVPKIVFCVVLEHGGSSYNACLVTKRLLRRLMDENLLNF